MAVGGIACDLCELHRDVCWVIRTDHFAVAVGDVEPFRYDDDEEWALCRRCKRDVLADDQARIIARRRAALIRDTDPAAWDALSSADHAAVMQVVSLIVMTVLATRQKAYGRAWTAQDERDATQQVQEDGGRGKRN